MRHLQAESKAGNHKEASRLSANHLNNACQGERYVRQEVREGGREGGRREGEGGRDESFEKCGSGMRGGRSEGEEE